MAKGKPKKSDGLAATSKQHSLFEKPEAIIKEDAALAAEIAEHTERFKLDHRIHAMRGFISLYFPEEDPFKLIDRPLRVLTGASLRWLALNHEKLAKAYMKEVRMYPFERGKYKEETC